MMGRGATASRRLKQLATVPIERLHAASITPRAFLELARSKDARPTLFTAERPRTNARSTELLDILRREAGETMIEAELSANATEGQKTMQLPLALYLDWLTADGDTLARIGSPPYLAQTRLTELVPALANVMPLPSYLAPHFGPQLDLYQLAHFLGPSGSTTPVHCDPFVNVLSLHATSDERDRKHVVLWPPDARQWLQDTDETPVQPNLGTNAVEIALDGTVEADVKPPTPQALSCSMSEGDALFIPRGWWHAIRNGSSDGKARSSWSAAVGAWFLPRSPDPNVHVQ